jgi:two-component system OmpR family sensor kinase
MGRLFWKVFLAFWLALLLAGAGVGTVVWLRHLALEQESAASVDLRWRAARWVGVTEAVLRRGGTAALRELFSDWERSTALEVFAVDETGRDLLGRPVPDELLERARALAHEGQFPDQVRQVQADDGHSYLLFMQGREPQPGEAPPTPGGVRMPPRHRPVPASPAPVLPITSGILASLLFSAWLAWYLAKPIRSLRRAFAAVAQGQLQTRVAPSMGRRRDELADLGREFDHMAGQIASLMDAQRRLLHDVSHELRSPLARLQAAIGLARQNPEKLDSTLARIERESLRLDQLVGELLTLSRLQAGVNGPLEDDIDLAELIADIVEDARFESQAKAVRLECTSLEPVLVRGRAELLHSAMENVLRNAVRHSPPNGCVIVQTRMDRRAGRFHLAVLDQGPGVAPEMLGSIFEPFFRGGGEGQGGFGLGLAIARRAVEAHGGTIGARNRPGGGLCVDIVLPARAAEAELVY